MPTIAGLKKQLAALEASAAKKKRLAELKAEMKKLVERKPRKVKSK